nr:hypothetical protein [uncultured Friedmanniella sp.]
MSSTQTTVPSRSAGAGQRRSTRRWRVLFAASVLSLGVAGCTPESAPAATDALTVDITIAGGNVTPNGQKLDVAVGQPVVLNVTSDAPDEIHAHTGDDGFTLDVEPGTTATGTLTVTTAGSFEVESHHLEKVIVILNAR